MAQSKKGMKSILVSLFAALTSASYVFQIPLPTNIPIVLQDMFALLSGLLLGPVLGGAAVFVFLILGCIGLPVFSGKSGIQVIIAGPTGGFLIGYFLGAIFAGLFLRIFLPPGKSHTNLYQWIMISIATLIGDIVLFGLAVLGFMRVTQNSFSFSFATVVVPYMIGTAIKFMVSVPLVKKLRPVIFGYLGFFD